MRDLKNARLIYLKAGLFLGIGVMSAILLIAQNPDVRTAALLGLAIWSFARLYYFAFYVIEHYVDPGYRFSGLWSLARHALQARSARRT
jgi:hypothetical protein